MSNINDGLGIDRPIDPPEESAPERDEDAAYNESRAALLSYRVAGWSGWAYRRHPQSGTGMITANDWPLILFANRDEALEDKQLMLEIGRLAFSM